MDGKKISFGFMKTKKAGKPVVEEKRDYIECVEEKSIKVVGGEPVEEITPLVIPLKPNTLITAERLKEIAEKVEESLVDPATEKEQERQIEEKLPENETLDQMAVRELLQDAKKEIKVETSLLTVPVPAKPVMDGEKESTLEDYDSVPIQDFGLAMLRGMGWTQSNEPSKYKQPQLRQKGLGLGADKVVKENQKNKSSKDKEEELAIVKNSYVKITTGKHSGYYGKVVSLDEDNGRVMVDIPVKKEIVSLSEFMMHPITKSVFDKESKVINADSYEQYKKNEKIITKSRCNDSPKVEKEATTSQKSKDLSPAPDYKDRRDNYKREGTPSNGKNKDRDNRTRRVSSSSEDRSRQRRKEKKKLNRNDSPSSLSDSEKRRKHKNSRRRDSSSRSGDSDYQKKERRRSSRSQEAKRDIDKKRKGKKKKRDRDRSPNYRKHRK